MQTTLAVAMLVAAYAVVVAAWVVALVVVLYDRWRQDDYFSVFAIFTILARCAITSGCSIFSIGSGCACVTFLARLSRCALCTSQTVNAVGAVMSIISIVDAAAGSKCGR